MTATSRLKTALLALLTLPIAASTAVPTYRRQQLSDQFFCEGATFADLNRDGKMDVIAGPYWYEGPTFERRHEYYPPAKAFDPLRYSDNFFAFAHDFNGDQWPDILILGFPGADASWFENPGPAGGPWRRHVAFLPVDNESPTFANLLGRGPVLLCASQGRVGYATWDPKDPARAWTFHAVSAPGPYQRFTHGLGFGDVNGDGRNDVLDKDGWWEQPASLAGDPVWKRHPYAFAAGARGGSQMHVLDVNGDGLNDVVAARDAHGYGLSWFEQVRPPDGAITFREHRITSPQPGEKINGVQFAQPHALAVADFDGDGLPDLLTGKRWWAHGPKGDADPEGPAVLYAFLLRRDGQGGATFEPHLIDTASGVGTQVVATDANGDGRPDVIIGNKRGTFVFLSRP